MTAPQFGRRLLRDGTARVGLVVVLIVLVWAVLGPSIAPYGSLESGFDRLQGPSWTHPLGTDRLGRDLLSRLLYGARITIGSGLVAALLVTALGTMAGAVAGYAGGVIDFVIMRIVDVLLTLPNLIVALVIAGMFQPGLATLLLALCSVWWVGYARIVRGLVLSVREWPFVEWAASAGASDPRILIRHILPNILPPVLVLATLEIGSLVLAIAALNFLGLGVQPPTAEWGAMMNEGRMHFTSAPHLVLAPGLAISLAVLGFNLLGDGLRDIFDPKFRRPHG